MKIKEIRIKKFKRFTNLTIHGLPETAKLILLVGPNGSGKTSVFEALNHWYKWQGFGNAGVQDYYCKKGEQIEDRFWYQRLVEIDFYDNPVLNREAVKGRFYFRTAHRNEPDFTTSNLSRQMDPCQNIRFETLMDTDACVSSNYQRLVSSTLAGVFKPENDAKSVLQLREELIGRIKNAIHNVFDDLELTSIGDPLSNGSFFFTKGSSTDFHYKNLSAGEKSAFDLLLDLIISSHSFSNSVFCIDEPEAHMHTALQSKLLSELYAQIPVNSQLWISTHSMGMLKTAKELEQTHPGSVVFLDFSDKDFDAPVVLTPSTITSTIWRKFMDLALGELSNMIAPSTVVFCEGTSKGRSVKNFDAVVYNRIFSSKYADVEFSSVGSCSEIENPDNVSMQIVKNLLKSSQIIKLVDRDDKSSQEIEDLKNNGIKVLNKRHIECYLLDDEIIRKLCVSKGMTDKVDECLSMKSTAINDSITRGNPKDDVKSAAGNIYNGLKQILGLTSCGNTTHTFLRDTIAPLITEDTQVYKDLEKEIFS